MNDNVLGNENVDAVDSFSSHGASSSTFTIFTLVFIAVCDVSKISIDTNSCNQFQKRKTQWKLDRRGGAINYQDGGSGGHQTGRDKFSSVSCGHQRLECSVEQKPVGC